MEEIYYIELVVNGEERREWNFNSIESRNKAYEQVKEKFKKDTSNEIPFMDLVIGNWINGRSEIVMIPFRLKPEVKNEVIKFMDLLEK